MFCRSKSPLSVHFTPAILKEPTVKVDIRLPKQTDQPVDNNGAEQGNSKSPTSDEPKECEQLSENTHDTQSTTDRSSQHYTVSPSATPPEIEKILKQQRREEELLQEQHNLLQTKLLHQYDRYIQDTNTSRNEPQAKLEIVNGQVTVSTNERDSTHPSLVTSYDLSAPEIIPNYSHVHSSVIQGEVLAVVRTTLLCLAILFSGRLCNES